MGVFNNFIPAKMFSITFKSGMIACFLCMAVPFPRQAGSMTREQVEIVTKDKKKRGRAKPKKTGSSRTTMLYLKNGCALPSTQLVPVLEFQLEGGTYVHTSRGYLPAARLVKGDQVFCRESDGKVSALEVGIVYSSRNR